MCFGRSLEDKEADAWAVMVVGVGLGLGRGGGGAATVGIAGWRLLLPMVVEGVVVRAGDGVIRVVEPEAPTAAGVRGGS